MSGVPRILLLCTAVAGHGGIQRFNRNLLAANRILGFDSRVIALTDAPSASVAVTGCGGSRIRFVLTALRALLFGRWDLVLVGHVNFAAFVSLALRLRVARRPPSLLVAHGIDVWSGIAGARRRALRRMVRVLCVSDYTRQALLRQAPEIGAGRCEIFPNALDVAWSLDPAADQPRMQGHYILSVGRLDRDDRTKGIITTLEALAGVEDRELRMEIAGTGNDLDLIRAVVARLGLQSRVRFAGAVGDAELQQLYRGCVAFVLPSGQEGFGIVFLEAMYYGAPVIAAAEKGALDVVADGRSGLLVRYGDVQAVRVAIERLASDHVLRARLADAGRRQVQDGGVFSVGAFVTRWRAVVEGARA